MKLTGFSWEVEFDRLRTLMGAELVTTGLDVSPDKIHCANDGTLEYVGKKVVVYIRDQIVDWQPYKFHIADCITLKDMRKNKKFDKFVVSTRTDGKFYFNSFEGDKCIEEGVERKLDVCKNCLNALNYKNYVCKKYERDKIVKSFNLEEFFKMYGSQIMWDPTHTDQTAPLNDYPSDWRQISLHRREQMEWKCEKCKTYLGAKKKRRFLHVHHIGLKHKNEHEDLKVLCIKCHAEENGHHHLKSQPDYEEYQKLDT